jgi:hypothetical protein
MLGVILITALLLSVVANFYIDLSNQATRASEFTREVRRASTLLDRIAADLEHTLLVRKPSETDPLTHPWLFLGESRFNRGGADQLKFVRRERPRSSFGPASDIAVVAYTLDRSEDGEGFALRRWSSPELPESLDRRFPAPGDPSALLVTEGIESFTLRFLDDAGEWKEEWDSSLLLDSGELPVAVEIEVALRNPQEEVDDEFEPLPRRYARHVQLPLRPLDLEVLLDPGSTEELEGGEGDGDDELADLTLADCIDFTKISDADAAAAGLSSTDLSTLTALAQNPDALFAPYKDILGGHPSVNPQCQ